MGIQIVPEYWAFKIQSSHYIVQKNTMCSLLLQREVVNGLTYRLKRNHSNTGQIGHSKTRQDFEWLKGYGKGKSIRWTFLQCYFYTVNLGRNWNDLIYRQEFRFQMVVWVSDNNCISTAVLACFLSGWAKAMAMIEVEGSELMRSGNEVEGSEPLWKLTFWVLSEAKELALRFKFKIQKMKQRKQLNLLLLNNFLMVFDLE